MTANASIFALPVYWLLAMAPHFAALNVLGPAYNNANPRSIEAQDEALKTLGETKFGLYERLEGTHKNAFENMPLFFAAVIVGNLAKLDAAQLNGIVWGYIASRLLYTILYASTSQGRASYARTLVFLSGVAMNHYLLIRSGVNLVWAY